MVAFQGSQMRFFHVHDPTRSHHLSSTESASDLSNVHPEEQPKALFVSHKPEPTHSDRGSSDRGGGPAEVDTTDTAYATPQALVPATADQLTWVRPWASWSTMVN